MVLKYEIIVKPTATEITDTLKAYETTKKSHTLKVLGFGYDGTNICVLVRYEE